MVLPRPLILALAGLALLLMSFVVVQRQRSVSDSPATSVTASTAPKASKAAETPRPARRERAGKVPPNANRPRERKPASSSRPAKPATPLETGVPAGVARALSQRKVIALLFTSEGAADDSATRSALRSLNNGRKSKVAVFTDSISNVGRYSRLVGSLGISQVPSVVIVDTQREAQLLEGYVDSGTLRQYVADAKR